ncbi:hypothetical protein DCC39_09115 [Pueribacillus theae]|uniref:Dihydrolipoamide acetyltransferase component of pyruvate dehydrogenase complex n=1 Tax=Pueribacillus theae TaxID=2171751 RepID=A0A2U1K2P2_9BACI|nr:dihydrolipoamide acetyltransferase family protein [Pueribacillus theae]PWA11790.1 hypothetical protein DCC39_09115 [Pueribacillus theae]
MNEVKMPRLGVTMQSGKIAEWLKEEGDYVEKGEELFVLETEKSTVEIEAQVSGVLKKILIQEEIEVPINEVIAIIGEPDEVIDLSKYEKQAPSIRENSEEPADSLNNAGSDRPKPSGKVMPRVRKLAKELGVSLDSVTGTGKGGMITEEDIRNASSIRSQGNEFRETIELNNIKREMSKNMLNSWRNIPQFTQIVSVNMEKVLEVKSKLDGVTINDLLVKTVGTIADKYPIVNSKLEDNKILVFKEVNISVAVSSKQGLVVPVVKEVNKKGVDEISKAIKQLSEEAEANQLSPDDFSGGTITVSNLGSLGIESGTPIINIPQSTIVFAGAIQKTPVVDENDEIVVKPMMKLSICYDHRFIDGVAGAKFTNELKNALENLTIEEVE